MYHIKDPLKNNQTKLYTFSDLRQPQTYFGFQDTNTLVKIWGEMNEIVAKRHGEKFETRTSRLRYHW